MTMIQPTADRNQDPNRLPERCCILLLPEQLAPTILESVPSNLRGGFRFYGSVTPQEYLPAQRRRRLSGPEVPPGRSNRRPRRVCHLRHP